jgi:DNA-binding SARP family transcriptional activator
MSAYRDGFHRIPLVGRREEREFLRKQLREVEGGNGGVIFINGAPGIGKTSLVSAALGELEDKWLILSGKSYQRDLPYAYEPFVEILRSLRRLRRPLSSQELEGLMRPSLPQLQVLLPELRASSAEPQPTPMSPDIYSIFEDVLQLLLRLSDYHPLCLFLDDTHWMDIHSIQLFEYIAGRILHFPIVLIACYREAEISKTGNFARLVHELKRTNVACCLTLSRLDKDEVQQLIAIMLDVEASDIPESLTQFIYDQTLGNPFFVKESVLGLLESGSLATVDGMIYFKPKRKVSPTEDLYLFIMQRVERLPERERRVLEQASVLGETFSLSLLRRVADMEETRLERNLQALVAKQFLKSSAGKIDEMRFEHPKIQEVVYDSIPPTRRRQLHRAVASALERMIIGGAGRSLEELAYHLSLAEVHDKALGYLLKAGELKIKQRSLSESLWYYERALYHLERLPEDSREIEMKRRILGRLGYIYKNLMRLKDALSAYEWINSSITEDEAKEDQNLLMRKLEAICSAAEVMLSLGRKLGVLRRLENEPLLSQLDSLPIQAQYMIVRLFNVIYSALSDWEKARKYRERHLELALEQKDEKSIFESTLGLYSLYRRLNQFERAREYANMALKVAERIEEETSGPYMNKVKAWRAWMAWMDGDFARCVQYFEQALQTALGKPTLSMRWMEDQLRRLAVVYQYISPSKSLQYAQELWRLVHGTEMRDIEICSLCYISTAFLELGEIDKAQRWVQKAIETAGYDDPSTALPILADLALLKGDGTEALRWICEYERRILNRGFPNLQYLPHISRLKGLAYLSLGDKESARKEADRIQSLIEGGGDLCEVGLAYADRALLLKELGETEEALLAYRKAQDILRKGGADWWSTKLQAAFKEMLGETQQGPGPPTLEENIPLKIRMFGGFQVERYGQPVPNEEWRSNKAKNVLKYLLLNRGRPVVRDVLLDLFWRDMDLDRAMNNLNSTIYTIRRVLEPDRERWTPSKYLLTKTNTLQFQADSDCWLDVEEFEGHLDRAEEHRRKGEEEEAAAEWSKVVELYGGELLPEDRYEDWCSAARERFRERYLEALLRLGEYHYGKDQFEVAETYYRRALVEDPLKEVALRMLMRCLVKLSRSNEALRLYREFARKLKEEIEVEPERNTKVLFEKIRSGIDIFRST